MSGVYSVRVTTVQPGALLDGVDGVEGAEDEKGGASNLEVQKASSASGSQGQQMEGFESLALSPSRVSVGGKGLHEVFLQIDGHEMEGTVREGSVSMGPDGVSPVSAMDREGELRGVREVIVDAILQLDPLVQIEELSKVFCVLMAKNKTEEFWQLFNRLPAEQRDRQSIYQELATLLQRGEIAEAEQLVKKRSVEMEGLEKQSDEREALESELWLLGNMLFCWCGEKGLLGDFAGQFSSHSRTSFCFGLRRPYFDFWTKCDTSSFDRVALEAAIEYTVDLSEAASLVEEYQKVLGPVTYGKIKGRLCEEMLYRGEYDQAFRIIEEMQKDVNNAEFFRALFASHALPFNEFRPLCFNDRGLKKLMQVYKSCKESLEEGVKNAFRGKALARAGKFAEATSFLRSETISDYLPFISLGHVVKGNLPAALECAAGQRSAAVKCQEFQSIANQCLCSGNFEQAKETLQRAGTEMGSIDDMKFTLATECTKRGQFELAAQVLEGVKIDDPKTSSRYRGLVMACMQRSAYPLLIRLLKQFGLPKAHFVHLYLLF
ncbi:MAG: hypothetical protein S4CHLAM102_09050 [Chlamydiia bacterium]|nr:hypothetical protein [Chlamydiia bacterium]